MNLDPAKLRQCGKTEMQTTLIRHEFMKMDHAAIERQEAWVQQLKGAGRRSVHYLREVRKLAKMKATFKVLYPELDELAEGVA